MNAQAAPRPRARGAFDASRVVVGVLSVGLLLSLISLLLPSGAGDRPAAATFTEGKVFEGRKYKYHLRAPPGGVWRIKPDFLLPPMAAEPDLAIDRPGSELLVMVMAGPMTQNMTVDDIVASAKTGQDGAELEEIERTPIQRGSDQGVFLRGRRPLGRKGIAVQLLVIARDNIMYVVTGIAPEPLSDSLSGQMSALIKSFEPPPPGAGGAPALVTGSPAILAPGTAAAPVTAAPSALPPR